LARLSLLKVKAAESFKEIRNTSYAVDQVRKSFDQLRPEIDEITKKLRTLIEGLNVEQAELQTRAARLRRAARDLPE
jgi:uncharacterized coiled-coil protein SlyX